MPNHPLNLSDRVFGSIRVLARSGTSPRGAILWACHCNRCGRDFEVDGSRLVEGKTDCGCSMRERRADLSGQHIGALLLLRRVGTYRSGDILYAVRCDICGAEREMPASTIRSAPKSCGCQRNSAETMRELSARGVAAQIVDGVNLSAAKSDKPTVRSTTGARGVSYNAKRHCYYAQCCVGGKRWYQYGFTSVAAAKKARDEAHAAMVAELGILQIEECKKKKEL